MIILYSRILYYLYDVGVKNEELLMCYCYCYYYYYYYYLPPPLLDRRQCFTYYYYVVLGPLTPSSVLLTPLQFLASVYYETSTAY